MAGTYNNVSTVTKGGKTYRYERGYDYQGYRCVSHNRDSNCAYKTRPNEDKIESTLLEKFNAYMNVYVKSCQIEDAREANSHAAGLVKSLKAERDRLNRIYRKGDMPDAE
jgi:hypothetical protein